MNFSQLENRINILNRAAFRDKIISSFRLYLIKNLKNDTICEIDSNELEGPISFYTDFLSEKKLILSLLYPK